MYPANFLISRRISLARQFLVSLEVNDTFTMEVNETRNCLVTDILLDIRINSKTV